MKTLKPLLLFILLITSTASFAQLFIDTTSIFIYDSISKSSTDVTQFLGGMTLDDSPSHWYNKTFEENGEEPVAQKFKLDTILQSDFEKYKRKYHSKINYDSLLVQWTDTSFTPITDNRDVTFNTRVTDYFPYCYYKGLIEYLNLYLVWYIDGHNEVGSLLLMDKKTGRNYTIESPFDEPIETALLSPKNNYLLSYANTWYENDHCFISILKIDKNKHQFKLQDYNGMYIDKVNISQIVWINENSFAISVTETIKTEDNTEGVIQHCFLKASFKD